MPPQSCLNFHQRLLAAFQKRKVVVLLLVILFLASCGLPCGKERGLELLMLGTIWSPVLLFSWICEALGAHVDEPAKLGEILPLMAWFANPCLFLGLIFFWRKKEKLALAFSLLTVAFGLLVFTSLKSPMILFEWRFIGEWLWLFIQWLFAFIVIYSMVMRSRLNMLDAKPPEPTPKDQ